MTTPSSWSFPAGAVATRSIGPAAKDELSAGRRIFPASVSAADRSPHTNPIAAARAFDRTVMTVNRVAVERAFKPAMTAFLRAFCRNDGTNAGMAALKGRSTLGAHAYERAINLRNLTRSR